MENYEKNFELTTLFRKTVDFNTAMKVLLPIFEQEDVLVTKAETDGIKRLAYSICGEDYAHYIFFEIKLKDKGQATKLSNKLNITDDVLRYLLVATN